MFDKDKLETLAKSCGGTLYKHRTSPHEPAVAFSPEAWEKFTAAIEASKQEAQGGQVPDDAEIYRAWDEAGSPCPLPVFSMIFKNVWKLAATPKPQAGHGFDECVASGQACQYGAYGPKGEQQCRYCGSEPPKPQVEPQKFAALREQIAREGEYMRTGKMPQAEPTKPFQNCNRCETHAACREYGGGYCPPDHHQAEPKPSTAAKFSETSCSSCGETFGPGNAGFSHCAQHADQGDLSEQYLSGGITWGEYCEKVEAAKAVPPTPDAPQADDFLRAVSTEAEHQRQRWGSDHDAGKQPSDWFWLVGYLGGKALHAHASGNSEKAEHHVITTAAALANWHAAITGTHTSMRPGIDGDAAITAKD